MTKKVLIIQHSTSVPCGYVTTFFTEQNIPFEILPIFDDKHSIPLPDDMTSDYSVIISLGGPQGAYEDEIYPYLKWEKSFLATQLALNTPILGICLGAQLLADVIGGRAYQSIRGYEAGYVNYELTPEGKNDPILSTIFEAEQHKPMLIMHHGDTFDLPVNVPVLARTSNDYTAAYRVGSAFCVQFHPEMSTREFNESVQRARRNRPKIYQHVDIDEILHHAEANESRAEQSRRFFFQTWWNSIQKQV
ncbi:unnamed protein product [Rotaria sp. Silwood1]|nr:unnamed protein product [Rotaria sp. Silwood1]CAF1653405.1 unnamed protein product [Rotaria sp. Silwood1]CAF3807768.1 unnamed protein product [Rotaria sp. Silwood1]CAF3813112.1 unnamed protein product [Rotaria sp. Silwood1]CAF3816925.1 unnamed protein product [Rotaria sp. Silwood1]